jgi:hypothetical protein
MTEPEDNMPFNSRYLSESMVTFVDLLGFSDRVRALVEVAELEALERDVRRVQEWFDHRPDKLDREHHKLLDKKVLAFSDCLVIAVSAHSQIARHEGNFDVLMNELGTLAYAQAKCAMTGIFIRGASSLGMWYKRRDTIISPALVDAYNRERDACVPMIAVNPELRQFLAEHPHRKFYSADFDPIPKFFRHYSDLPNGQSAWFLDYLPIALEAADPLFDQDERAALKIATGEEKDELRAKGFARGVSQLAKEHAAAIMAAHAAATLPKVRAKYEWLSGYHDEALARFWPTHPPELGIGSLGANPRIND